MGPSSLTALAEQLLNDSRLLDSYNEANGLEPVSFDHESFVDLLEDIEDHRKNVINIAQDLKRLAQGPRDLLFETGSGTTYNSSMTSPTSTLFIITRYLNIYLWATYHMLSWLSQLVLMKFFCDGCCITP